MRVYGEHGRYIAVQADVTTEGVAAIKTREITENGTWVYLDQEGLAKLIAALTLLQEKLGA